MPTDTGQLDIDLLHIEQYLEEAGHPADGDAVLTVAKVREQIAELRGHLSIAEAQADEAGKLHMQEMDWHLAAHQAQTKAEAERDEARECVGRLCAALQELRSVQDADWQSFVDAAIASTPEHLRLAEACKAVKP